MSSTFRRNTMLIHIVNSAFDNHARFELLVEAHENETEKGGHAYGYESRDAVDAHGYDVAGAAGGVHFSGGKS